LRKRLGQRDQSAVVDEAAAPGDLLQAADLQPLPSTTWTNWPACMSEA